MLPFSNYGLVCDSPLIDNDLHRCGTTRKPRSDNGWYIILDGGKAAIFGNWELGDGYEYWREDGQTEFRPVDRERIERIKAARTKEQERAAEEAIAFFEKCSPNGYSDYLKRKRAYPHGARFDGNVLIIPAQDSAGKIWSYQRVYGSGDRFFLTGGRIRGCYYPIFPRRNVSKDELVVVCEGFATGAAIHQETDLPVVVAFSAGNIKPVSDSLPFRNLVIAADNDQSGVGERYAKESGYRYVMPDVTGWDFSDVFLNGKDVKQYFIEKKRPTGNDLTAHGLVGEIADWITATAIYPQPKLSIAAALAFVAMLKGHRYETSTGLRSNILVLCLAPSASGKEHPQNCIMRLMQACGVGRHLLADPTSGSGFLTGLLAADRLGIWVMDEIGRYLSNFMNSDSQGFQREVIDYIIKSFTKANSILVGKQYANPKINPRIDIENPHFCCLGSTVKEKIVEACRSSDVLDGFLNRWILFSVETRPEEHYDHYSDAIPEALIARIKNLPPIERDSYGKEIIRRTNYSPEAADIMRGYREAIRKKISQSEYPFDSLYGRSSAHAAKIAMIVAEDDYILPTDVKFAIRVVEESNEAIVKFAGLISDNQFESDYIRVRELIAKFKSIKKNVLTRKTQFINGGQRRRDEIIKSLVESNIICEQKINDKETCYKFIG